MSKSYISLKMIMLKQSFNYRTVDAAVVIPMIHDLYAGPMVKDGKKGTPRPSVYITTSKLRLYEGSVEDILKAIDEYEKGKNTHE